MNKQIGLAILLVGCGIASAVVAADDMPPPPHAEEMMLRVQHEMKRRMNETDADQNGEISRAEFLQQAESRFNLVDENRDGKITQQEFEALRQKMMAVKGRPPMPPQHMNQQKEMQTLQNEMIHARQERGRPTPPPIPSQAGE
jgi:hypothetical protein